MERIVYSEDRKTAYFDGYKFRRDAKTGYYLANKPTYCGRRERLHCYVWRHYNGPIPEGFHIHHRDENKYHNDICNLACVPVSEHTSYHSRKYLSGHLEESRQRMEEIRPLASTWHRSSEGRAWHRKHASEVIDAMQEKEFVCQHCGKTYKSLPVGLHKFCSNNCKAAARRKSGVDDETRVCDVCGKEFTANKYSTKKYCSRQCTAIVRRSKIDQKSGN